MGVSGLQSFVRDASCPVTNATLKFNRHCGSSNILVCDALSFVRTFYPDGLDFIRGGQWDAVFSRIQEFIEVLGKSGFVAHMVFDGVDEVGSGLSSCTCLP
jgi:hypothetical protein